MFFSPALQTPDTSWYMIVGYAVFITLPILFIASMIWRQRNLKRDEEMISTLLKDEKK
jgi:DMSO/TMAO reductase YedYZ heme-binding membrane subunit